MFFDGFLLVKFHGLICCILIYLRVFVGNFKGFLDLDDFNYLAIENI